MHKSLEYSEGKADYYDGKEYNPYHPMNDSDAHDDWADGWNDAKEDDENEYNPPNTAT